MMSALMISDASTFSPEAWWKDLPRTWQEIFLINLALSQKLARDKLRTLQTLRQYYYAPPR
ncbi:MAG: hypothetical protein HC913_18985 [Microscillaceae bacterium]|nr:hypothetical protein [Microscillaceae bacterium]